MTPTIGNLTENALDDGMRSAMKSAAESRMEGALTPEVSQAGVEIVTDDNRRVRQSPNDEMRALMRRINLRQSPSTFFAEYRMRRTAKIRVFRFSNFAKISNSMRRSFCNFLGR